MINFGQGRRARRINVWFEALVWVSMWMFARLRRTECAVWSPVITVTLVLSEESV
jgi:steroid 5-alpha reductase family enzyme